MKMLPIYSHQELKWVPPVADKLDMCFLNVHLKLTNKKTIDTMEPFKINADSCDNK